VAASSEEAGSTYKRTGGNTIGLGPMKSLLAFALQPEYFMKIFPHHVFLKNNDMIEFCGERVFVVTLRREFISARYPTWL
jgi:hypothetical protein